MPVDRKGTNPKVALGNQHWRTNFDLLAKSTCHSIFHHEFAIAILSIGRCDETNDELVPVHDHRIEHIGTWTNGDVDFVSWFCW